MKNTAKKVDINQAVNLAICLDRGFYYGTVARDKAAALEALKSHMNNQELNEFTRRIR